jgi:opacity protein-like surface antigen
MKTNNRDNFDDLLRSKLYDFEADTTPGDWAAIEEQLPMKSHVPLRRKLSYWAAAAVIALLMTIGGVYFIDHKIEDNAVVVQEIKKETEELSERIADEIAAVSSIDLPQLSSPAQKTAPDKLVTYVSSTKELFPQNKEEQENKTILDRDDAFINDDTVSTKSAEEREDDIEEDDALQPVNALQVRSLVADEKSTAVQKKSKTSKWGFGMGAGSLAMGADNVIPQFVTNSTGLRAENLFAMNAFSDDNRGIAKTNIKHNNPLSFGLGVSYTLKDRWALQSGVTYSYLKSSWQTNMQTHGKTNQELHFIGIPLSLMYQFAELNDFRFYTSAGVMAEMNVAGRKKTRLIVTDPENDNTVDMPIEKESTRMKELLWSLNARAGVAYPLLKFLSAYAEVGASYYFDNGSDIETIRSEKPFNVGLQLGFRIGL